MDQTNPSPKTLHFWSTTARSCSPALPPVRFPASMTTSECRNMVGVFLSLGFLWNQRKGGWSKGLSGPLFGGKPFFGEANLLSNFLHVLETNSSFRTRKFSSSKHCCCRSIPSRELTSPTWGRKFGKSSTQKWNFWWDMWWFPWG